MTRRQDPVAGHALVDIALTCAQKASAGGPSRVRIELTVLSWGGQLIAPAQDYQRSSQKRQAGSENREPYFSPGCVAAEVV
jgi:hypothetical protein